MPETTQPMNESDQRQYPRYPLPAAYTAVRVRRAGEADYAHEGHAYDISMGGVRFELDEALDAGEHVDLAITLPGRSAGEVHAHGVMVRMHDPEEVGPVRMGLCFDGLASEADRRELERFLLGDAASEAA